MLACQLKRKRKRASSVAKVEVYTFFKKSRKKMKKFRNNKSVKCGDKVKIGCGAKEREKDRHCVHGE